MKTKRDQINNHNGQMMDTKPKPEASSQIMIATSKNQESLHTEDNRNFPFKLYDMLEFASVSGYCSVVSWTPDGHSFAILNDDEFLNNIVPMFFKQTKLRSFTRQLNLWGFHRIVHKCSNKGAWYSKYFVRGQPNDLKNIMRMDTTRKFKNPRRPSPPPSSIVDIPTMAAAAAESAEIQNHFCSWSSWINQSESEDWMGAQLSCGASSAMGLVPSNIKGKPSNGSNVSQQISPLSKTELEKLITTEWDFTTSIIQDNFSNGSAFHYRSKLLPLVLESRLTASSLDGNGNDCVDDEQKEDPGTSYKKRCEVILNMAREEWDSILLDAIFTEPDNQTLWWYHRFIVSWSKPKINAENDDECYREMVDEYEWLLYDMADSLRELLEVEKENGMAGEYSDVKDDTKGAKCKWAYLGLHLVLSSLLECRVSLPTGGGSPGDSDDREVSALREEAEECLKALTRIDPNRCER